MQVLNIHDRELRASAREVGALIDSLASPADRLWPRAVWPRMRFDRPLGVGAVGGHGPIRYAVEDFVPGISVRFRFLGPKGFDGWHGLELNAKDLETTVLRHVLSMTTHGPARLSWPLVFRPLHDALIEDAFTQAELALGLEPVPRPWSPRVRCLRWLVSRGKARPQRVLLGDAQADLSLPIARPRPDPQL